MSESIGRTLEAVLAGNIQYVPRLLSLAQDELTAAASDSTLTLGREAVVSVLNRLSIGEISPADAQRWASFVRRGYFTGQNNEPIRPLDIMWEPEYETAMAEAVGRLDELGDSIDGTLQEGEIEGLLDALTRDD